MNQNNTAFQSNDVPPLFNDVYFKLPDPATNNVWAPFPRLLVELRLHVWLHFLQQYQMIDLDLYVADHEDDTTYPGSSANAQSRYYTDLNHLGNIVSNRGYVLSIRLQAKVIYLP